MLLEHQRSYGLGMGALVTVCSRNTKVLMVWAWVLWSAYALGTRTLLWFGHGCSHHRVLCNTNVILVWAWMLQLPYALGTQTLLWFGHGCYSDRMLLEHERYYGLGMDAPVTVCSWNTNVIMVGHGCSHHRVLCNTNVIMVWAWMLQ